MTPTVQLCYGSFFDTYCVRMFVKLSTHNVVQTNGPAFKDDLSGKHVEGCKPKLQNEKRAMVNNNTNNQNS